MDINLALGGAALMNWSRSGKAGHDAWERDAAAYEQMLDGFDWVGRLFRAIGHLMARQPQTFRPAYA